MSDTRSESVAARVREARETRTALRIIGAGQWLHAGAPCTAERALGLRDDGGVVAYEPGDLVLTVRAGTSLAEIDRVTRAEGQWLALDPHGTNDGTIGATIATASAGPLASAFGTPRDHVLGCTVVTGAGDVVQAGGRVVKNVAGFDLVRLVTGAWGTLGIITEVTVRLRAVPQRELTLVAAISTDGELEAAWRWVRASEVAPMAAELVSPRLATRLGMGATQALVLRFGGNAALVDAGVRSAATLGRCTDVDMRVWSGLRASEPADGFVARASCLPSEVVPLWRAVASEAERAGGFAHATLGRGVVRCVVPLDEATTNASNGAAGEAPARFAGMIRGTIDAPPRTTWIVERGVGRDWPTPPHDAARRALSARVRAAFDPDDILNPGILIT